MHFERSPVYNVIRESVEKIRKVQPAEGFWGHCLWFCVSYEARLYVFVVSQRRIKWVAIVR